MSEQAAPQYRSAGRTEQASGWAVGFIYPLWSLTVIALDIVVIWALAAHGGDVAADRY